MALFTDPPELTCGFPEIPKNSTPFAGVQGSKQIFNYGGKVFTGNISRKDTTGSSTNYPIVFKRTAGVWSKPDSVNWQLVVDVLAAVWFPFIAQCRSGNKIHIVSGAPNPYYLFYWAFDLATEQYDAATASPYFVSPGVSSEQVGTIRIAPLSDGRMIVAWGSAVSNVAAKVAFITAGGAFTAGITYEPAAVGLTSNVVGLAVDASDTAHILYQKHVGAATPLWHVTVTSAGVVGTPTLVEASVSSFDYSCGPGCMFGGKVTFAASRAFDANIYVFETDPTVIAWSKKTVAARTNDTGGGVYPVPAIASSGALWIHWWEQDSTTYPASGARSFYSIYDGSAFTAKAIGWDAGVNQYPGAGVVPDGDIDMSALTSEYDGTAGMMQLLGWSEFTSGFDESELYLETPLAPPVAARQHRVY